MAGRIVLASRQALSLWGGNGIVNVYNDASMPVLGAKHPGALGASARETWAEVWDEIGPATDAMLHRGGAAFDRDLLLILQRDLRSEETYFTCRCSPVPDDAGGIGGVLCALTEETERILGQRRLALLRGVAGVRGEGVSHAGGGRGASGRERESANG